VLTAFKVADGGQAWTNNIGASTNPGSAVLIDGANYVGYSYNVRTSTGTFPTCTTTVVSTATALNVKTGAAAAWTVSCNAVDSCKQYSSFQFGDGAIVATYTSIDVKYAQGFSSDDGSAKWNTGSALTNGSSAGEGNVQTYFIKGTFLASSTRSFLVMTSSDKNMATGSTYQVALVDGVTLTVVASTPTYTNQDKDAKPMWFALPYGGFAISTAQCAYTWKNVNLKLILAIVIPIAVVLLLGIGFAIYWFKCRKSAQTEDTTSMRDGGYQKTGGV